MGNRTGGYRVLWENLRESDRLKYIGLVGGILVTDFKEIVWEGLDWFDLVHGRDK